MRFERFESDHGSGARGAGAPMLDGFGNAPDPAAEEPAFTLTPGHNCWRIERATRLQFLIDGEEYFGALRATLRRARRSIDIIGWDIDSRMRLEPAQDGGEAESFGELLHDLVMHRRELRARVLNWDYAMLFALEREWLPQFKAPWRWQPRLQFRFDKQHPFGASHHQKIVVVDDRVAFVGGFDIANCRWDTAAHAADDPRRCDQDGKQYGPFHDVHAIVEGPVAAALGELARQRWQRATGRRARDPFGAGSAPPAGESSPWPPQLPAVLADVDIAIARTEPAYGQQPACTEIRQFYLDAIAAARRHIFIENQYFSAAAIGDALSARLAEENGPAVVVITPQRESGWLEESTMGVLRARLYQRLRAGDAHGRFRPYCPVLETDGGCLNVHSKVLTIDDEWLTLGSANLSNRSMGLDTECNLILAAAQGERAPSVRAAIAQLRNRLLGEHLAVAPAVVAAATRREGLIGAIESLRGEGRSLSAKMPQPTPELDALIPDQALLDPEQPLAPEQMLSAYVPGRQREPTRSHALLIGCLVIVIGALTVAWRETPLHEYLDIQSLLRFAQRIEQQPLTPLWVMLAYVGAGLVAVPVVLLIAVTAMVFGPWLGIGYALAGSLLSAAVTYALGAKIGRNAIRRLFSRRLHQLDRQLAKRGLVAVTVVRLLPLAPFTVVNLIAGAAQIGWRNFLLGTAIGMLPGIAMTALFVDRVTEALERPSALSVALLVTAMGAIVAIAIALQHWLRRRESNHRQEQGPLGQPVGQSARATP